MIRNMIAQEKALNYQGTKVMTRSAKGKMVTAKMRFSRKAPDTFRMVFLEPADMQGQEFIKIGQNFWRVSPDKSKGERHMRMMGMRRNLEIKDLDLLSNNYTISYEGTGTVAGRTCYVVRIEPRGASPVSAKLWLDKHYYFALKAEEYVAEGGSARLRSSFHFEDISFHPTFSDDTFTVPISDGATSIVGGISREKVTAAEAQRELKRTLFLPEYIPAGFRLDGLKIFKRGGKESFHAVYTDGLGTISLFEGKKWEDEPRGKKKPEAVKKDGKVVYRIKRGPLTVLTGTMEGTDVTLMGEVSQDELLSVFSSLKKVTPQ